MGIRSGRVRRALLAALVTGAVVVPVSAAAHPAVPAPAPAHLGPVTAATLGTAYRKNRATAARAAETAAAHGDRHRARALRGMASTGREFLTFDARGAGRAAEVFGDLTHADRIAVLVPGSDTSIDTYDRFRAGARALHDRLGDRAAVVAWLGYETPGTVSAAVATTGRAEDAAPELVRFIGKLRDIAPGSTVSLLCHSYGSVVCGRAAPRFRGAARVCDLVLIGSPGTGADSAAGLGTPATVWAGRGGDDWIADVPHVRTDLFGLFDSALGFGADPVSRSFGAHVFAAGDGGHSDYFRPGSPSLANLARIALGRYADVTEVSHG
ncbi:alpha/beta hydrolase [Streptomyces sp. cg35]|uniref:alpha/beta hydrolase n=1 Tax=Streptomyces sp. cg35 TaxID=3421650 RepID=UPI003D17007D